MLREISIPLPVLNLGKKAVEQRFRWTVSEVDATPLFDLLDH